MASLPALLEHLLRRAGFGASPAERENYAGLDYYQAVSRLVDFDPASADIDDKIGTPGYVGITTRGAFSPNVVINDARQRWLFRMVHAPAPLREKMALLWHNHFATGYTKVAGEIEAANAARMMDAKPSEDPAKARGQIELFRQNGLGKFRDLLVEVAKDPAMLVWLDGRTNFKAKPQENFGRELMELFTFGVANYVETDVYAAARVFTGWNLRTIDAPGTAGAYYAFNYASGQHDTGDKVFSFPIYPDGTRRIQGRSASAGLQDGLDLINALAIHPETAKRLVRKLWVWFISETVAPTDDFVDRIADIYLNSDTSIKATVRAVLVSPEFMDSSHFHTRYSWPAEYVVRMLKEVGYVGFSVSDAIVPMLNMGQALFDPPDVAGWALGSGWFSTGGMLARMNFASQLANNQKFAIRAAARPARATPQSLTSFALDRLSMPAPPTEVYDTLLDYVRAGGTWTGTEAQLLSKTAGLVHLLTGSGQYQFV
jgi:uncharacterized protein (DUF1800 family)